MSQKKFPLITFCGMDGTGKTTIASKLVEFLRNKGIDTEFIHGHGYSASKNSFGAGDNAVRKYKYLFRLGLPLALADNIFTFSQRYNPVLKNSVLICDRYFYDKVARLLFYGICNETLARLYLRTLPKPDLVFFLDISAEKAHARKSEYLLSEFILFRRHYQFVARTLNAPVIDTNNPPEKILETLLPILRKKTNLKWDSD